MIFITLLNRGKALTNKAEIESEWGYLNFGEAADRCCRRKRPGISHFKSGRGERIRTSGLCVPNAALYQAKLHPVLNFAGFRLGAKCLLTPFQ